PILVVLLALVVSRAVAVYGLLGGMAAATAQFGWETGFPRPWLHLINWSGLRGAVAVALALSLPADLPYREMVHGVVFGCVLLTLLIQGGTAQLLVSWLGLRREEPEPEPA
ncbi:MAG TPA: cation:proton antiporter, partial [Candidatus Limnocylindria bacterium]